MNSIKVLWGSFLLSKTAWTALFSGWVAFFLSLALSFEIPSSGALMICGVVAGEVFHSSQMWLRFVAANADAYVQRVDGTTGDGVSASHFGVYTVTQLYGQQLGSKSVTSGSGGSLFSKLEIMDNGPLRHDRGIEFKGQRMWSLSEEAGKYDKLFHLSSAITAFAGSVLWGYGHLIWA